MQNYMKKHRAMKQQQQRQQRASSSTFATTTTIRRSSLFRCRLLASLRRRGNNCNSRENNHPPSSSVATPGQEGDDEKKKLQQQRQPNNNHEAEELELQRHQQQQQHQKRAEPESAEMKHAGAASLLLATFLTQDCPTDVLPRILAYAGPQMTRNLQRSSRFFYNVLKRQGTWRILCEELYKWKPGEPEPSCWKEHYRLNPCVPVDFNSISSAIEETVGRAAAAPPHQSIDDDDDDDDHVIEIHNDLTVWLRPGRRYFLPRTVNIAMLHRTNQVRIETQQLFLLPESSSSIVLPQHHAVSQQTVATSSVQGKNTYYKPHHFITPPPAILVSSGHDRDPLYPWCRQDVPLFRVTRGTLVLRNVHLQHYSHGNNIWNGNAAIQVQPAAAEASWDSLSSSGRLISDLTPPRASAILHQVQVQSSSGRGIVAVDGGQLHVHDSYIHDCAATGVYVGGALSKATLIQTDVIGNGTGNRHCTITGGGIARGHSGVYVEQGTCELDDCSVSRNSASGICVLPALAPGFNIFDNNNNNNMIDIGMNAELLLTMRKTDVLSNESNPLDLPQRQQQLGRQGGGEMTSFNVFDPQHENNISPGGTPRPRSSILLQV